MDIKIQHKMIATLLASLAIVMILGVLTFQFIRVVVVASRHTAHAHQVLILVERIRTLTAEAQLVAIQGMPLGDSSNMKQKRVLRAQLNNACNVLDSLVNNNAGQTERVD